MEVDGEVKVVSDVGPRSMMLSHRLGHSKAQAESVLLMLDVGKRAQRGRITDRLTVAQQHYLRPLTRSKLANRCLE